MIYVIGEVAKAEDIREQYRFKMRITKDPKDKAEAKREFRKARNKVLALKRKIND